MPDHPAAQPGVGPPDIRFRWGLVGGLAVVVGLGAVLVFAYLRQGEPAAGDPLAQDDPFTLPEIAPANFRNATRTVGYVGNRACIECHAGEHQSYLLTTHSRSLGEIDSAREPPNGEYRHELSGRSYRIYRDGAALKLREFIRDDRGQEVVLADHPARYGLGSGNYSRMYLVEAGDFLLEAPVTWYPRRSCWGMSAGYEKDPHQRGFTRAVGAGCLNCHTGRVERIGGAEDRVRVVEQAISCERCHGPGELHVKERTAGLAIEGRHDDSIVNPRRLPRERHEDICAQCHLSAAADVAVRGRSKDDFRPGLRMPDFAVSFRIDRLDSEMKVSGQVDQMRLSRCYKESGSLTCTTCHDPHPRKDEVGPSDFFRDACLRCHKPESCGLPAAVRTQKEPKDNCIACHMPRGPTEIPHFTFTNHRIGIHTARANDRLNESDRLVPVADVSHLPEKERQRLLGLAHETFSQRLAGGLNDETRFDPYYRSLATVFRDRARSILEEVRSSGLRDPDVEDFFSRLHWRKDPERCIEHAELALQSPHLSPATRKSVLYNLGTSHFDQGRYEEAFPYLDELAKCDHSEIPLMLLAICHQKKGNLPEAIRLVKEAIATAPDRADLHGYLASIYRDRGQSKEAEFHRERARLLARKVPQPR